MAATADHEGLAPPHGHEMHPGRFFASTRPVEVGELADVMNLEEGLAIVSDERSGRPARFAKAACAVQNIRDDCRVACERVSLGRTAARLFVSSRPEQGLTP